MKRCLLVIIVSFCCVSLFPTEFENLRVHLGQTRDVPSNGAATFTLRINNRGSAALHQLELSVRYNDDLQVVLGRYIIDTLEPGETIGVTMEIANNRSHFFDRNTPITLIIANEDHENTFSFRFTIRPVEHFWLWAIVSLAAVMTVLFIIVYIKANKGEKNAG